MKGSGHLDLFHKVNDSDEEICLSLCDGVGTGFHVLKGVGLTYQYVGVEIDPTKRKLADHGSSFQIVRYVDDVYEVLAFLKKNPKLCKRIKVFLCGFTCTSLSPQGKRELWDGDSKIFFECAKILEHIKKYSPDVKFFFENVSRMPNECRDTISSVLGVSHFEFDSGIVSPQARVRYYWFNWPTPALIEDLGLKAKSFLDKDAIDLVAVTKSKRGEDENGNDIIKGRVRRDFKAATLTTGAGCRGQSSMNQVITNKFKFRNLTVNECAKLQGVSFIDFSIVSKSFAYDAIGDGWQFDAVKYIFESFTHKEAA